MFIACLKDIASYEREVTQLKDENTQLKAKISELERICAPSELLFCYFKITCKDRKK